MNSNPQETLFTSNLSAKPAPLFPADWHPQLGARLAVFPRCLHVELAEDFFWPDLATFIEDCDRRLLMYYAQETPWSLEAEYSKSDCILRARLYWEHELVWCEQEPVN